MGPLRTRGVAWKGGLQGCTSSYPLSSSVPPPRAFNSLMLMNWCLISLGDGYRWQSYTALLLLSTRATDIENSQYFFLNKWGFIKKYSLNTRLVCTHLSAFFMLHIAWKSKFWKIYKKNYKFWHVIGIWRLSLQKVKMQ